MVGTLMMIAVQLIFTNYVLQFLKKAPMLVLPMMVMQIAA
jgi:hypothetical protein